MSVHQQISTAKLIFRTGRLQCRREGGEAGTKVYTRCNSAVSILRIDTAELHRVYDNMLQRAQKCIDVQGDHFQHLL